MTIETLLLLALPASGKSELRRYLGSPSTDRKAFGLGPLLQLDDYPYVHLMRRISEEQRNLGLEPTFFASDTDSFLDGRDWGTLIHLLNEDFARLTTGWGFIADPGTWLIERLSRARSAVGADADFAHERVVEAINAEAAAFADELRGMRTRPGATIVIEFARGGPHGAMPPIKAPYGYAYSIGQLSDQVLNRCSILYVWVSPEESRRRNRERAHPDGDASILHHGVPESVMLNDYGVDDIEWLMGQSATPGFIHVRDHRVPITRFDNRVDKTSFLQEDIWPRELVDALRVELLPALAALQAR